MAADSNGFVAASWQMERQRAFFATEAAQLMTNDSVVVTAVT